jgi:hypothetical protein
MLATSVHTKQTHTFSVPWHQTHSALSILACCLVMQLLFAKCILHLAHATPELGPVGPGGSAVNIGGCQPTLFYHLAIKHLCYIVVNSRG